MDHALSQKTCPICLEVLQPSAGLTEYPCGHIVCTPCFEDMKALADQDASVVPATTCALCRTAVYERTRHGSSLIKQFPCEKISSAKRDRGAASSTQRRARKQGRTAEHAGSSVLLPNPEGARAHTPSPSPLSRPSDPRTSTRFYDTSSVGVQTVLRQVESKLLSNLSAPILDSLRPRGGASKSISPITVVTKPSGSQQIGKLRYDKLVHGGQWLGSSSGSNEWEPVLSHFVIRNFRPWFVKECRQREGRCVKVPAGASDVSRTAAALAR